MMNYKPLEIYIHIPFCVKKCDYCDFLSAPADEATRHTYMKALLEEVHIAAKRFEEYEVVSIFVGGGTPSVVDAAELCAVLQMIQKEYRVDSVCEVTVEMNPGTVDREKLAMYKKAGVNRLSIGLQTPVDAELKAIGRIHTFEQFMACYEAAVSLGFDNINVDIMSALPGQTVETYGEGLKKVLSLEPAPKHISAYSLIWEEGTPLMEKLEAGLISPVDEDTDREMYCLTEKLLSDAGYRRYEISNYAKEGYECRHNIGYWTGVEYIGFGIGASSLVRNVRFKNCSDTEQYIRQPSGCIEEEQVLSAQDRMEEFMFLGLRLTNGVSVSEFEKRFGAKLRDVYGEVIEKNRKDELLTYSEDGERLFLTAKGLDLSNYVYAQFIFS